MAPTKVLVGLLGIGLAFAPELLYGGYGTSGERWGLSPLDDLHVAGLLMALEQSVVMGIALVSLFTRMLAEADREDERAERYEAASPASRRWRGSPRTRSACASVSARLERWYSRSSTSSSSE